MMKRGINTVMKAQASDTQTEIAADCSKPSHVPLGNKHMNLGLMVSNFFNEPTAPTPEDRQMKYQSYQIRGSNVLSAKPEIQCKEDIDGSISCDLPDKIISYRVEDLNPNTTVIDDYFGNQMGEISTVSYFVDGFKNRSQKKEIEKAVLNYNEQVLKSDCVVVWESNECELDYDIFNMDRFFEFCKESPEEYGFIDNQRTPELDEVIIGIWLKNHK